MPVTQNILRGSVFTYVEQKNLSHKLIVLVKLQVENGSAYYFKYMTIFAAENLKF